MEGPKLPPTRPTLAATHPELGSQGESIIKAIVDITEKGPKAEGFIEGLPGFFDEVVNFVSAVLAVRGPYDEVAHWVEQTYKAVQRLEKAPKPKEHSYEPEKLSWAAVAAQRPAERMEEEFSLRRIKVRIADSAERKSLWKEANNEILQRVVRKAGGAGVVGIRKLPSGDIAVQTKEQEGKVTLGKGRAWVESIAPSARTIPDLYPVMVQGVLLKNIDTTKQAEAIKALEEQNQGLHPGLAILRVAWPRGIHRTTKYRSSLTVFVGSPERANQLIHKGVVEGGEVKNVVRFVVGCGIVQCFKCCRYGHIAKYCRLEPRCGKCGSGDHETRECTVTKEFGLNFCVNCKGNPKSGVNCIHFAWDKNCPVRQEERRRLYEKLLYAPTLYLERSKPAAATSYGPPAKEVEKKKPGRPFGSKNKDKETPVPDESEMDLDPSQEASLRKRKRQLTLQAAFNSTEE